MLYGYGIKVLYYVPSFADPQALLTLAKPATSPLPTQHGHIWSGKGDPVGCQEFEECQVMWSAFGLCAFLTALPGSSSY